MVKVKLALIGAGAIAKQHLEVIQNIDWIEAAGITSRTKSKADLLAKEYNIPICADNIEDLISQAKPNALLVLVSADQIYPVTAKLFAYKLPLFIEKPPGLLPKETQKLVQLAQQHEVHTMVGFNRRYYSVFNKGLQVINDHGSLMGVLIEGHERMWLRADQLSKIIRSHWIYVNNTHMIDLVRFFGGEPSSVRAIAHRHVEPRGDQFAAIMELTSGAIGQYLAYWYSPGGWRVVLYGQGVTVEFKPLEKGFWIDKNFKRHEIQPEEVDIKFKPGFFRQMEAFGKMVRDGLLAWPGQDLAGAAKTMRLADQFSLKRVESAG